jgi:hypothetical protein
MPTFSRKARIALDWTIALLFPRIAQLAHSSTRATRSGVRRAPASGPLTHPPYSALYLNAMFTRDR